MTNQHHAKSRGAGPALAAWALTSLTTIALGFASTAQAQSAQAMQTRSLAATCANCHGTDGKAVPGEAMVALAGMSKETIVAQLQAFRDGKRPATVMHQIAKGYTDEQMQSVAAYFAAQK